MLSFRLAQFLMMSLLLLNSEAFARFYHLDANEVDREELLTSEYYNDIASYQNPIYWQTRFDEAQLAYRALGGSLDVSRSYVEEDIKLLSSTDLPPVELQFKQYRKEDLLEQTLLQEVRFQFNSPWGLYLAPMIDAVTFKKWNDFGAAFGFQNDMQHKIEVYAWTVDHYYNEKEEQSQDRFEAPIYTYGTQAEWYFKRGSRIAFSAYRDTPLKWKRNSQGYIYGNSRTVYSVNLQSPKMDSHQAWIKVTQDIKNESKEWTAVPASKAMSRRVREYSIGVQKEKEDRRTEIFVSLFQRKADYENSSALKEPQTEIASPSINRQEYMIAGTYNHPFFSHFFQWGLFYNHARIAKEGTDLDKRDEFKLQTGFEMRVSNHGYAFLNGTWDLDRFAAHNYKLYRSWGGGSINVMIAF